MPNILKGTPVKNGQKTIYKLALHTISLTAAILAGKITMWLVRLSGKGKGSSLPGMVA